jgi:flagellar basal body-associated protein FliL
LGSALQGIKRYTMLNDSKRTKILLIVAVIVLAILGGTVKGFFKQDSKKSTKAQAVVQQIPEPELPDFPLFG